MGVRKRVWVTVVVVFILAVSIVAFHATSQTPGKSIGPQVGAFLYLWYGNATTGIGGLGSPGWNSSSSPGGGSVVDQPDSGFYVSDSNRTFQTQISQMEETGLTFAIVSWWGPSSAGEAGAINKATIDLFNYLKQTNSSFRVAVMADAFPDSDGSTTLSPQTYAFIQHAFVTPYNRWYFQWEGKPLLLLFNPLQPGPDANFTIRTVGNRPNPVNWTFWDAPESYLEGVGGGQVNMSNDVGNPVISPLDGEVTLVPRIDSYYNYAEGHQSGYLRFDPTLQQGLYQYEWNYLLEHETQVKLVLIYSWNEYHERTSIEPHVDLASVNSTYLSDLTAYFISEL